PAFKTQSGRWVVLLFVIASIGAYGIWANSRRPFEAPRVSQPPSVTSGPESSNASVVPSIQPAVKQPARFTAKKKTVSMARAVSSPAPVTPSAARTVPLHISISPKFSGASLTVWVDNQTVLQRELEPVSKKKLGLFGHSAVEQNETIYVAPGEHQLRVNA